MTLDDPNCRNCFRFLLLVRAQLFLQKVRYRSSQDDAARLHVDVLDTLQKFEGVSRKGTSGLIITEHGLWNGRASLCLSVCPYVRLCVPSIDSSSGVRRVCCWAPCGQEISTDSCRRHMWGWTQMSITIRFTFERIITFQKGLKVFHYNLVVKSASCHRQACARHLRTPFVL